MVRIIINGCYGRMGRIIAQLINDRFSDKIQVVAGIDKVSGPDCGFQVYDDIFKCDVNTDIVVDYSHPSGLDDLLKYVLQKKTAVVIATTGMSEEQKNCIKEAAKEIPVFYSANMSVGINLLSMLARKAAKLLEDDFDIEILERHHNQKIDAPSGTAYLLADAINDELRVKDTYVYDRHSVSKKRDKHEIGISSIRGGSIAGDHEIIFAGNNEIVELRHHAQSREIFALGTVRAVLYLNGKASGMYDMNNLIAEA